MYPYSPQLHSDCPNNQRQSWPVFVVMVWVGLQTMPAFIFTYMTENIMGSNIDSIQNYAMTCPQTSRNWQNTNSWQHHSRAQNIALNMWSPLSSSAPGYENGDGFSSLVLTGTQNHFICITIRLVDGSSQNNHPSTPILTKNHIFQLTLHNPC